MTSDQPCAVIFNPIKVDDTFRADCEAVLTAAGRSDIRWLETTADDPGRGMVAEALEAGADLVIAAGGDGTVRVVADGLAETGVVLGVMPSGTANLLALNLGIPADQQGALDVITGGRDRKIDLIRISVDDGAPQHSAVMAGAGLDAMIMGDVNDDIKAKIGTAAYFLSAGKALGRLPMKCRISIDGGRSHHRKAMIVLLGNVGKIQGLDLIPQARPDDGRFDLLVASPRRFRDWFKVVARLITRRKQKNDPMEFHSATRVEIELSERDYYELDGDVEGEFTRLHAEIVPGALLVRVPTD